VVNNADDPPFATLIKVNKSTGKLTLGARITFDAAHGVDATNGAEQPVWDKATGKFYISIPQIGANPANGAVARISPSAGAVDAVAPVQFCQPAGLALGPKQDLMLGCSVVFDTAGNVWSATGTTTAAPISVIMDAGNGSIDKMVTGVSGSDEVWFNPGDGRYYLAARNQPGGPVLGVIDAKSRTLVQVVPTLNVAGKAFVFPAGTAHSLAANPHNNRVFVPLPANNVFPACLNGCIGVFGAPGDGEED
jgi:sugar lactone lactonase YvrE